MTEVSKAQALHHTAMQMVAPGKGLLAADESTGTIGKRFEKIQVENTEQNRQTYRGLLFTAPDVGEHISGVILYDETIRQSAADGRTFVSILEAAGVLPGIKVDEGTEAFEGSLEEKITKGLEGLPARLPEYVQLGAKFAKWRAVLTIGEGLPTDANIRENARRLAAYAKLCQDNGLVPIVEPEVLMDWSNTLEVCRDATERTLMAVFEELKKAGVAIDGMILKPNMVIPGKKCPTQASPEEVAKATVALFEKVLPAELPGVVFLSGGQSEAEATANLNAMNAMGKHPWPLSFSYGRALQASALEAWKGKDENIPAAQHAFLHRAELNGLATLGTYRGE
ncbi:MAG: fructose-bisphosphate aldolase class I [Patescibacteria group bacterium]|nr:fructose-bisphosphate aldolase class I [Patescibacteria group bacterium]